ncbi:MAG: CapA family protein [Undibacterium sp.]
MQYFRRSFLFIALLGGMTIFFLGLFFLQDGVLQLSGREISWSGKSQDKKQEPSVQSNSATILFGGDMQFDRYIRSVSRRRGGAFIFDGLRSEFQKADLVVANLEGPITDRSSVSETSLEGSHDNYVFTFPAETATLLHQENVRLVNIGNNHILNFTEEGVRQTKEFLKQADVQFFGSPIAGDERVNIQALSGIRIGFINYNEFVWRGREKAFEDIAAVKGNVDFIVIYTHWGKEYVAATDEMKTLAHEFIDAGADLVIGSHPHVVQEKEEYQGKWIYYSLGNLIFDQYFRLETQSGLMVRAMFELENRSISPTELPVRLKSNGQTELVSR